MRFMGRCRQTLPIVTISTIVFACLAPAGGAFLADADVAVETACSLVSATAKADVAGPGSGGSTSSKMTVQIYKTGYAQGNNDTFSGYSQSHGYGLAEASARAFNDYWEASSRCDTGVLGAKFGDIAGAVIGCVGQAGPGMQASGAVLADFMVDATSGALWAVGEMTTDGVSRLWAHPLDRAMDPTSVFVPPEVLILAPDFESFAVTGSWHTTARAVDCHASVMST